MLDPTTKHQKATPEKLVFHIYKRTNKNLNISIGQLITCSFFFGMQSCKYSTTPKGEENHTCILQKWDIRFCRKRRKLFHNSGILHLADKVSLAFCKQKNEIKMTQ